MKKIILDIKEFLHFRQVAEQFRIQFSYGLSKGKATILANANDLEKIGY